MKIILYLWLPAAVYSFCTTTTTTTTTTGKTTLQKRNDKNTIQNVVSSSSSSSTTSLTRRFAIKEATFGMGCFWEPSEALLKVDGVVDTIAGYTGVPSATKAPTYDNVCFSRDWVEGVRVKYDDEILTYPQLLNAFYETQKPKLGSRQYASIIFPHDAEQEQMAKEFIQSNNNNNNNNNIQQKDGGVWLREWTTIEPKSKFFKAEGYHQRYWQKQRPRFAAIISFLAISTGIFDSIIPLTFQKTVETGANAAVVAIGLYIIAERYFDSKVVEL